MGWTEWTVADAIAMLMECGMLDLRISRFALETKDVNDSGGPFGLYFGCEGFDQKKPEETDDVKAKAKDKDKDMKLTGPDHARSLFNRNEACDLLETFVNLIDDYLSGGNEYAEFEYLSANEILISIDIDAIIDFEEGADDDPGIRAIFFQELPNIIQLYKKVGWEDVYFEKDEERSTADFQTGELCFAGSLPGSSYRKLLKEDSEEEIEEKFEQKYVKETDDEVKLTSPEESLAANDF